MRMKGGFSRFEAVDDREKEENLRFTNTCTPDLMVWCWTTTYSGIFKI